MLACVATLGFTSCDDDNDSNPTLNQGNGTFVLNTPEYAANNIVDLENSQYVTLTCSQPNYGGVPYVTIYAPEVSLDGNTWQALPTTYTTAKMQIAAKEVNNAILDLAAADANFDAPIEVFFKLKAHIDATNTDQLGLAESNVIKLPAVKAYVPNTNATLPEKMFMTGSYTAGNGWGTWNEFSPVYGKEGLFYIMVYMEPGSQFKINPESKWGGKERGYNDGVAVVDDADAVVSASGDGNFVIETGGWYSLLVKTAIEKGEVTYTMYIEKPDLYIFGACAGDVWEYSDDWKFTVPADANGDFVSPALAAGGEVRIAFKFPSIDWWRTECTLKDGLTITYRTMDIPNNWQESVGSEYSVQANAGQKVYMNFTTGTGKCE